MPGRIQIDLFVFVKRNFKLRTYSLSAVAKKFLKDDKLDLPAQLMFVLFGQGSSQRKRIAEYCMKDCVLPLRIMEVIMTIVNIIEMARVSSTVPNDIMLRGQQEKVMNSIVRYAHQWGFVINEFEETVVQPYKGATVIEPLTGFYSKPVAVLDFASLYPSIMIDKNLSHDTYINDVTKCSLPNDAITKIDNGNMVIDAFANHEIGILPRILQHFLSARKAAKKLMGEAKTPMEKSMYNAKQLALKVTCNSVYGFCGADGGKYPCLPVARCTTTCGRDMIVRTKRLVEDRYPSSSKHTATVIYGDTDSVMVAFANTDLGLCFKLGNEAADYISSCFGSAIELEMEKVFWPYLLFKKKRYAALKYESIKDEPILDVKGVEMIRRDATLFTQKVYEDVLRAIMYDRDVNKAQTVLHNYLCDLEDGKISSAMFEVSCQMKATYKNHNLPQVRVVEKMRNRAPGSEPKPGDRMTYIVLQGKTLKDPVYTRAEDPLYVKEHNLPIDYLYVIENQLEKPISSLFDNFTSDTSILFRRTKRVLLNRYNGSKTITSLFGEEKREMPILPSMSRPKDTQKTRRTVKKISVTTIPSPAHPPSQFRNFFENKPIIPKRKSKKRKSASATTRDPSINNTLTRFLVQK
jgi:DNA polymerase delta subunit 1